MLKLKNIRLIRFEPEYHTAKLYEWYYSGDYPEFFRGYSQCPSAVELAQTAQGRSFMIARVDDNQIVGMVQFFSSDEVSRNFDVGLLIDKEFQGQELAPLALKVFLQWRFNSCNFFKAKLKVLAKNKRLCDMLEKFGAVREGGAHAVLKKDTFFEGKFHDIAVYAVFKADFNQLYSSHFQPEEPRLEPHANVEAISGRNR